MTDLFYINENTSVDEIIERILYDYNNHLAGQSFSFHEYCIQIGKQEHDYNKQMEVLLRDKMFDFKLVNKLPNTQGFRNRVELSGKGIDIYNTGGWKKYKLNYDKEQQELNARQNKPSITVQGPAIIGDNNQNNNQSGRDLSVFPHIQPKTSPSQNITNPKHTEVNMSKAQFISWLFTAFIAGITLGATVLNILKQCK